MGTISDKLMRIINTKEDIRRALILKGYDVPTSIPFKEYAKMISDLPCKVDDFPKLPGDVTRWHFGGLTNEMMAAMDDPRIEDADHKGRFLSFKNFAWGGMSGVGGYSDNFSSDSWKKPSDRSDITWTSSSFNITRVMNTEVQIYYFSAWEESESVIPEKRIIVKGLEDGQVLRYMNVGNRIIEISQDGIYTIPSFTFKGANSYHGYSLAKKQESCNVTVEQLPLYPGALIFDGVDDYGVCENFPILNKEKGYTVVALRQWINNSTNGAYLVSNAINNGALGAFIFERDKDSITYSFGRATKINVNYNNPITYQISNSYNSVEITMGTLLKGNDTLLVGVDYKTDAYLYANVAIWELVFLDHDATEEELTKIKDYFVKTYPWLFPDQAWTVVGKTNEDEDRATIANITGNGNNLVLSNFGFIEGSGYNEEGEYAGYLVTDGVDDEVRSAAFTLNEDWTIVGNWEFITNENKNAGLTKVYSFYLHNRDYGIFVYEYLNAGQGFSVEDVKSLKAICSDGRIYLNDWQEIRNNIEQEATISKGVMAIGYFNRDFTKMAFKNLGIYNNQLLSKDDCIKAYNYLQTLKSK